jgi:hypothetical protein
MNDAIIFITIKFKKTKNITPSEKIQKLNNKT